MERSGTAKPMGKQGFERSTNAHAHNIFLQAWYETGAVGGLLLLTLMCVVWQNAAKLGAALQPHVNACFAAALSLAWATFSLWSIAHIAMFAIGAIFVYSTALAVRAFET